MINRLRFGLTNHPVIVGISVFVGVFSLIAFFTVRVYRLEQAREAARVRDEAENVKEQLTSALSNSATTTRVLTFLVEHELLEENFDSVSHYLLKQNPYIDAMQLVEGGTITKTYPLRGNEAAIGLNIMEDDEHYTEALRAIKRRELYFEGPFQLTQGGVGVVGRNPIFQNGQFWGFAATVIRLNTLLAAVGISDEHPEYEYQLYKAYMGTGQSGIFFGPSVPFDDGIYHAELVPVGNWVINVRLRRSDAFAQSFPLGIAGLLLSLVLGFLAGYMARQPMTLREKVRLSTEQIQKQSDQLETTNRELEQFAYAISHDLQEPLRMISSFLTLLQRRYEGQLDEKGQQYITFAVDGAGRMRQIILDILELSRVGRVKGEAQELDLNEVLDEVSKVYGSQLRTIKGELHVGALPTVTMARSEALQIFQNLVGNAIKYSSKSRSLRVEVSAVDKGDHWQFAVTDNGIGIDPEHFERIFVVFQRLHTRQEYSGTGVGLSIVKKIIDSNGGKIWVESEPNEGSTFYFTLPKMA